MNAPASRYRPGIRLRAALVTVATVCTAIPASAMSEARMRAMSVETAYDYLARWSSDGAGSVARVPFVYGETVRFFGHDLTRAELMAEKRRAVALWPVRSYSLHPGTLRVSCNVATRKCAVRSSMDYRVSNPARGTAARGSARFDLGVGFDGSQPRILYEDGSRRGHE